MNLYIIEIRTNQRKRVLRMKTSTPVEIYKNNYYIEVWKKEFELDGKKYKLIKYLIDKIEGSDCGVINGDVHLKEKYLTFEDGMVGYKVSDWIDQDTALFYIPKYIKNIIIKEAKTLDK